MKLLITGICGFVGSTLARRAAESWPGLQIVGVDNFSRPGAETNRLALRQLGVELFAGDLRTASDVDALPAVDWVIDAAANPSVLAGLTGPLGSRQLVEHNLLGTVNLLEYCRRHRAGFLLLSTSRVYSIPPLSGLKVRVADRAFVPDTAASPPAGLSAAGVSEGFSTSAPVSLYGATKLASECLALEYGATFDFPVWINRCGVLAGAGQFGRPDQGIFAYWIHAYKYRRPLKYIGFDGAGHQVRDCLHPRDLVPLVVQQFKQPERRVPRISNFSGGRQSAMSLLQLSDWCGDRFGSHQVASDPTPRPFDIPWMVLDSSQADEQWAWKPQTAVESILDEIARHADAHPGWLELSAP